jgi:hypothetical protein
MSTIVFPSTASDGAAGGYPGRGSLRCTDEKGHNLKRERLSIPSQAEPNCPWQASVIKGYGNPPAQSAEDIPPKVVVQNSCFG